MKDYSKVTNEEFAEAVRVVAAQMGTDALLGLPGVWEVVSEALNNEALELCESADVPERCLECGRPTDDGPYCGDCFDRRMM